MRLVKEKFLDRFGIVKWLLNLREVPSTRRTDVDQSSEQGRNRKEIRNNQGRKTIEPQIKQDKKIKDSILQSNKLYKEEKLHV